MEVSKPAALRELEATEAEDAAAKVVGNTPAPDETSPPANETSPISTIVGAFEKVVAAGVAATERDDQAAIHPLLRWFTKATCTEMCFVAIEAVPKKAVAA